MVRFARSCFGQNYEKCCLVITGISSKTYGKFWTWDQPTYSSQYMQNMFLWISLFTDSNHFQLLAMIQLPVFFNHAIFKAKIYKTWTLYNHTESFMNLKICGWKTVQRQGLLILVFTISLLRGSLNITRKMTCAAWSSCCNRSSKDYMIHSCPNFRSSCFVPWLEVLT